MMHAGLPGMLAVRHAVENNCTVPVTDGQIAAILCGEGGIGPHVRAVFCDASLAVLAAAGRSNAIDLPTVLAAYDRARTKHDAINPELDEALRDLEALGLS